MLSRVRLAARRAGVPGERVWLLEGALHTAMLPRVAGASPLPSESNPAFLHPGRTVLILLDDLAETDVGTLAVGALAESRDLRLRVGRGAVRELLLGSAWSEPSDEGGRSRRSGVEGAPRRGLDPRRPGGAWTPDAALELWDALPVLDWFGTGTPADGELRERLASEAPAVLRLTLAEALDHLRHAHLWDSRAERVRARELAEDVLAPLAPLAHPILERRLSWWTRRVGRNQRRFE